ncbi:MAG: hypothetical protein KJ658_08020 [Proteobacteria bacterium]|nr:hypothetical protein [Desulfobacula sp.]MBU3952072.1 hypothetical protein [Pseudomonadota bacterium]
MSDNKEKKTEDNIENIRIGYQSAIDMWAHCGDEAWSRFNVMLVAHGILIAIAGSALLKNPPFIILTLILTIAGLFLSFLWVIMMERAFAYQSYFLFVARDFEENGTMAPVETILEGRKFDDIETFLSSKGRPMPGKLLKWIHKKISAENASYLVILIFTLIYLALFVVSFSINS